MGSRNEITDWPGRPALYFSSLPLSVSILTINTTGGSVCSRHTQKHSRVRGREERGERGHWKLRQLRQLRQFSVSDNIQVLKQKLLRALILQRQRQLNQVTSLQNLG